MEKGNKRIGCINLSLVGKTKKEQIKIILREIALGLLQVAPLIGIYLLIVWILTW